MKRSFFTLFCVLCLSVNVAWAQDYADNGVAQDDEPFQAAQPPTEAPSDLPPPPPLQPPSPPVGGLPTLAAVGVQPGGQWVFTGEYGWVYMPYGDQYVCQSAVDESQAYAFVYLPTRGWGWLTAPWIVGWGAYPFFGAYGPWNFGWYVGLAQGGNGWHGNRGHGRPTAPASGGVSNRTPPTPVAPRIIPPRPRPGGAAVGYPGAGPAARGAAPGRGSGRSSDRGRR